jgi:signal recognition particle subunit SEC65
MVIYLSGPMSGYIELNFPEFHRVAKGLRDKGYKVISPAEIKQPELTWESCMRQDIKQLMDADAVAVMEGWEKSKGASIEVNLAKSLGMQIIDAYTLELCS